MSKLQPEDWMIEIENGLEFRRQYGREAAWKQLEKDYFSAPGSNTNYGANLIQSMGDSLLSSLVVPTPAITLTPTHPNGIKRAPIVESIDNWLIKETNLKREVEASLLNAYLYGRGIIKIGYDSEFGWSPYYDVGDDQQMGLTLTQFDKKGNRIESNDYKPGMPWVKSVLPHDIVVPWGTVNFEDADWVAHRIIRKNAYIKKDAKYKNTSNLEPQLSMEGFMESYYNVQSKERKGYAKSRPQYNYVNKKAEFNVLWEIHDKLNRKIYVISEDYNRFLRESDNHLQIGNLPFASVSFIKHPRSFWTTPLGFYLGHVQKDEDDIARSRTKQRRISLLKFLARRNSISEDQVNALISGDAGAVAFTDDRTGNLKDIITTIPQGTPINFQMETDSNRRDARDAMGFSRNQLGEFDSSSRRTAREATFVREGSELRTSKRMDDVVNLYEQALRIINNIVFTNWKTPRYAMVDNNFVQFTGQEIAGNYLFDLALTQKRNVSPSVRKMEAMQVAMQLAQFPGADVNEIKKYVERASSDPAFEGMLGLGNKPPQQAQSVSNQAKRSESTGREKKEEGGA